MSISQTIVYDTPGSFTYDAAKIQVTGGKAALKLIANPGQSLVEDFADDTGFTYDASKAEFAAGLIRQLDLRPAGSTFGAKLQEQFDANFALGDKTATRTGSVGFDASRANFTGGKLVWDGQDNVSQLVSKGCVRFRYTPNYDGAPVDTQLIVVIHNAGDENKNTITLLHHSNGAFFVLMNDQDGVNQISSSIAPYVAVNGEEIEVEFSWDTSGNGYFFGQGYLVTTIAMPFVRSNEGTVLQSGDTGSNFHLRDLIFFDDVQHTANYTAGEYTVPTGAFAASVVTLPALAYAGVGALQAFSGFTATESGSNRYTVNGKYWNGSAWVTSDSTYAQASSAATVAANIAALTAADTVNVKLFFVDADTQANASNLAVGHTGQIYPTDNPSIEPAANIGMDSFDGFSAVVGGTGTVKFQLRIDGTLYYWSGAAWVSSDGTYAQANTAAEIQTNHAHASLVALVGGGVNVRPRALLHSVDGSASPDLTSATISYDFFAAEPPPLTECIVYGFALDILGEAFSGSPELVVELEAVLQHGAFLLVPQVKSVAADAEGRWEISLVETASKSRDYNFSVRYTDAEGNPKLVELGNAQVPSSTSANIAGFTFT